MMFCLYFLFRNGSLPCDLGQLAKLQTLSLAFDNFTGTLCESYGRLSDLLILSAAGNSLTGKGDQIAI